MLLALSLVLLASDAVALHVRAPFGSVQMMAGFGSSAAKGGKKSGKNAVKPAKLSMKRQWDRFNELSKSGAPRTPVFARVTGDVDDAWTAVGEVACAEGVPVAAAVQLHKRFILEHAARVSPKLALKAKSLECGFASAGGAPGLLEKTDPADAASAGFEGAPDASGRYKALSNIDSIKQMDEASSTQSMGGY